MNKLLLSSAIAISLAACASVPSMPSSITSLTNKVTGKTDEVKTTAVTADTAPKPVLESSLQDTAKTQAPVTSANFDPIVVPAPITNGRFKKTPVADMRGDTRKFASVKKLSVPMYKVSFDKKAGESA